MSLRKYTKEWLEELCKDSNSYSEVLRKAGRAQAGGSQALLKKKIAEWKIDVSHFEKRRWAGTTFFQEKYTPETLFTYGKEVPNITLRDYILKYNLLEYKCSECGCDGTWRGKKISLHLHHKDGDHKNCKLDNLTFLCPNCHAATENYGGKKNIGQKREV